MYSILSAPRSKKKTIPTSELIYKTVGTCRGKNQFILIACAIWDIHWWCGPYFVATLRVIGTSYTPYFTLHPQDMYAIPPSEDFESLPPAVRRKVRVSFLICISLISVVFQAW